MSERKRFSVIETDSNRNQSLEERLKDFAAFNGCKEIDFQRDTFV
jgi:hypothetical protein